MTAAVAVRLTWCVWCGAHPATWPADHDLYRIGDECPLCIAEFIARDKQHARRAET